MIPLRKLILILVALCVCIGVPSHSFTEDSATVRLAKTIYTLAGNESYETKLAVATVIMNRVENPWYPGTLEGVLAQQQQFPCGSRYDEESLAAAHEALTGTRVLPVEAISLQAKDASAPRGDEDKCAESGSYNFYTTDLKMPL